MCLSKIISFQLFNIKISFYFVFFTDRTRLSALRDRAIFPVAIACIHARSQKWGLEGVSSAEGTRMEALKARGWGLGRGLCPIPRKIFVFSPLKWCILMHSGGRLTV